MDWTFTKMQGCGNDYIYFDCWEQEFPFPEQYSIPLSDRHFGVGGDGIVLICRSAVADAKMRMFNLDGSEGKMCGNAIRCVGKYLSDRGRICRDELTVETLSGIKHLRLYKGEDGTVEQVRVNMGQPELIPEKIPAKFPGKRAIGVKLSVGLTNYTVSLVSMGNPHCVTFVHGVDKLNLEKIGPQFEHHALFPERINTEFIELKSRNHFKMRVWERGSGETWACGTGACAAAVAAVENGFCGYDEEITVSLRGGDLTIRYNQDGVWMTGAAVEVFEGTIHLDQYEIPKE